MLNLWTHSSCVPSKNPDAAVWLTHSFPQHCFKQVWTMADFSNGCQLFHCLELSFPSTLELSVWSFDVKPVTGWSLWDPTPHVQFSCRPSPKSSRHEEILPNTATSMKPEGRWWSMGLCSSQASRRRLGDGSMGTWRTNVRVSNLSVHLRPGLQGERRRDKSRNQALLREQAALSTSSVKDTGPASSNLDTQ